jgi:vacuolar-type H+-ATPase subunit I/STV1
MNVEGKQRIQSLVKARFPEADPIEKILEWVSALSKIRGLGQQSSNALGIEGFNDLDSFVLEDLLKNLSIEEMQQDLQNDNQTQNVEESLKDLESRIKTIQQSLILQPLLTD